MYVCMHACKYVADHPCEAWKGRQVIEAPGTSPMEAFWASEPLYATKPVHCAASRGLV